MDVERVFPPSIYNAPPFDDAVQEVNVMEERENWCPSVRVTESAPPLPFTHSHLLNVMLERVMVVERDGNSNIVPFPFNRVKFSNVTPSHVILPLPISNSGVASVP